MDNEQKETEHTFSEWKTEDGTILRFSSEPRVIELVSDMPVIEFLEEGHVVTAGVGDNNHMSRFFFNMNVYKQLDEVDINNPKFKCLEIRDYTQLPDQLKRMMIPIFESRLRQLKG